MSLTEQPVVSRAAGTAVAAATPQVRPAAPGTLPGAVPGPVSYPHGTLLKKANGPEVAMMHGHELRRMPDYATSTYMGLDRGTIQTIPDSHWNVLPIGPAFLSRSDGTTLRGDEGAPFEDPDPRVYVMQGGQRHLIPDRATFNSLGLDWGALQTVSYDDLNAIPEGSPIPEGTAAHPWFPIVKSQDNQFPASGGFMHTDVTIFSDGLLNAVTHTWEVTDLRGFKGGVATTLLDQNNHALWVSATQHYGVDGKWIGTSDRTENWSDRVPAEVLPNIRAVAIVQHWNPDVPEDIKNWVFGLTDLVTALANAIQKVKTAFS
jgi:hypothetical protein